jgi:hypothetical protein
MDVVTISFLVAASLGAVAAVLHMVGYVPPRYKRILSALQDRFASKVGVEVENALDRVSMRQRALMEADAAAFQAQASSAEASSVKSAVMSMTRGVGVEKQMRAKVDSAMAEAILGPAKPILASFAPGLLATLEENPQLLPMIIEHPLFQKYIAPRIQQLLGNAQANLSATESGWGT